MMIVSVPSKHVFNEFYLRQDEILPSTTLNIYGYDRMIEPTSKRPIQDCLDPKKIGYPNPLGPPRSLKAPSSSPTPSEALPAPSEALLNPSEVETAELE